ncbi:hypothetical protein IQ07DRAFT_138654 [Pyrenochaeta sp. DS3sAY3a]|nr:hypothetical protein IQ07DRAFT_138654 [Pyrenochaeta sp. DS3sAY3a]
MAALSAPPEDLAVDRKRAFSMFLVLMDQACTTIMTVIISMSKYNTVFDVKVCMQPSAVDHDSTPTGYPELRLLSQDTTNVATILPPPCKLAAILIGL